VTVEPARQLLQRAREIADLVVPLGAAEPGRQPAAPFGDRHG
jgi:hypothetical protein